MIELLSLPEHENYQATDHKWLGNVPSHWELRANKYIFSLKKQVVGKRSAEYDLLSLTLRGIIKRDMDNPEGKFPAEFDTYQKVSPGDFVFCHFDVEETPRTVGLSDFHGMITGAYTVYRTQKSVDPRFLLYFYLNADSNKKLRSLYTGLRNTISKDAFASFKTPTPPLPEQRAIAALLDDKCAKIDEAVKIKEDQIALLRERRQIIIQDAVTRGLNPVAPMKDSGIDWIGQIPAHWEVKRLRFIGDAVIGLTYDPKNLCGPNEGTLVLRSSNLKNGHFVYGEEENVYIDMKIPKKLYLQKDDILICSRNGSRDLIGKCAIADVDDVGASFGAFTTVFRSKINRYLFQILNSDIFRQLSGSFLTATINQLTTTNLNSISVPIPPEQEREQIRVFLTSIKGKIETAIAIKERQIAALKEYRTCLINAAVTGKIKVI
jgi:type I restriction enzyme S subunit